MGASRCPRFTEHFGIQKSQHEVDFVDILPDTDLPLYIDPYAFKVGTSDFAATCNNLVIDFFDTVVDSIRHGSNQRAFDLLTNLREPNEVHLGVSAAKSQGRGLGREQASTLYHRLADSKAAKSGLLRDLSDCELLIPGISHDKISDITTNIIRGELAKFTKSQCQKYGVPTKQVERGIAWLEDQHCWKNDYAHLPIYNEAPILLVPKWVVRRELAVDHHEYYGKFVLQFLQQEHLRTGSGLVEVLKSGKRRVTKASLKPKNPLNKDFLRQFSEDHPEVLKNYHDYLNTKLSQLNSGELEKLVRQQQIQHGGTPVHIHFGDNVMQKNTVNGNVNSSVVGSGSINARNITAYIETVNKSKLDQDTRSALIAARKIIENTELTKTDKADVSDSLGRLTAELEKTEREPGLIRRYFNRIREVASTAATILSSIQVIKDVINPASG